VKRVTHVGLSRPTSVADQGGAAWGVHRVSTNPLVGYTGIIWTI